MLSLAFYLGPLPAAAQLAPGEIVVTVTDAATKAPIADAVVVLFGGDVPQNTLTGPDGSISFGSDIQPGSYSIEVQKDGYKTYDVADVEVRENKRIAVAVALESSNGLKTIATVVAKASASISTTEIGADSAERKVSASLRDALAKIAGVAINDTTYGANSGFGLSLGNNDASQTGYSVNGIRIAAPVGGDLGASPLFSGASVSFAPSAGFIGGTINYQSVVPSKFWTYNVFDTNGAFGAATESATLTGTAGRLGMAFQHAVTRSDSTLSGLTYEDQSGTSYLHEASDSGVGDLLRLTYTISPRVSLRSYVLATESRLGTICNQFTTLLPCGYGPDGRHTSRTLLPSFGGTAQIGSVLVFANVSGYLFHSDGSGTLRTSSGPVVPYLSQDADTSINYYVNASASIRRHTISLAAYLGDYSVSATTAYNGVPLSYVLPQQSTRYVDATWKLKANAVLSLTHEVSFGSATGVGSSLTATETVDWKIGRNDSLEGTAQIGTIQQPTYAPQHIVNDPLSADYDCYNHSVFLRGPNDPAVPQSSAFYQLAWRHTFRGGSIDVSVNRTGSHGKLFSAAVPVAAEPEALFPGGLNAYLSALQSVWNTPGVCGSIPFTTDHIYVQDGITGLSQVTGGARVSARIPLGSNVMALPSFFYGRAYLTALDPRLEAPGSFYAPGAQVPNRPLHTAGLTIDGALTHANIEWLANAQYTDGNNYNNLPAFTVYTAGLVFKVHPGEITLLEYNLFNSHAALFSTYQGVNPMRLVGGGTFALSSIPIPPRQWTVTWRIPWSQRIPPPKPSPAPPAKPSPVPTVTPKP